MSSPVRLILRIGLAALTAVLAVNLYTGAPLFAVWVGSKLQGGSQLRMGTVGVVILVLLASVAVLVFLLTRVEAAYKVVTGQKTERRTPPWLKSMRGERDEHERSKRELTGFERMLAVCVVTGVIAFEVWFFFFSGSPIG
jgi:hypothetical protein